MRYWWTLALLLIAGSFWLWSGREKTVERTVALAPTPATQASTTAASPAAMPVTTQVVAPVFKRLLQVDISRRQKLRRDLFQSHDFLQTVRELLPQARAGDAEAQLWVGFALTLCKGMESSLKSDPAGAKPSAEDAEAIAAWRQNCGGLLQADPAEVGTGLQWLKQSAEQGNGFGMLLLAESKSSGESQQQRVAELHRAMETFDPTVVDQLVDASWAEEYKKAGDSAPSRDMFASEALTKCALGYDCTASGALYDTLLCKRKGCLHADGVERYFELSMSPSAFAEAQAYSQRLATDLRSGGYDWPEAQLLEQGLTESPQDEQAGEPAKTP